MTLGTRMGVRTALLLWSGVLLTAVVAAPLALAASRPESSFLYAAFQAFCHQHGDRSWHLQGQPLAVCVRCFGLYCGVLMAAAGGLRLPLKAAGIALAMLAASWATEVVGIWDPGAGVRFTTGLLLGAAASAVLVDPCRNRRWLAG